MTLITVLLATPLAYIMSTVKIRFASALQILILVSSMSAPFIGAYAWIMLCGRNGTITNFLLNTFGIKLGDIYGFKGCVIVMSLQLYSLVFMFVSGAFKNMDNSLIEASESLGCSGIRKIFKVVLPLILPTPAFRRADGVHAHVCRLWHADAHWRKLQHPAGRRL